MLLEAKTYKVDHHSIAPTLIYKYTETKYNFGLSMPTIISMRTQHEELSVF